MIFLKLFNRHLGGTPWWHLFSDLSIWEALFSKVGRPCGPNRERIFPAFRFPLPWRFFVEQNHWPGSPIRTRKRCEEFTHQPVPTCVFFWEMPKSWITWKHLKAPAKKLRSLLPIFQTKIATTQTMTASKWRKEAYVIFFLPMCHGHFSWLLCGWNHDCFQTSNWSTRWDLGEAQSPVVSPLIGDSLEWPINPSQDLYAY